MVLKNSLIVLFTAAMPISELRGAIPLGMAMDLPFYLIWINSFLGNIIPIIPIFLSLKYLLVFGRKNKTLDRFFDWWFLRVNKKSEIIRKYGFWGLVLFVAVPLPVTGAWTGTAAAFLMKFKLRQAFFGVLIGVFFASIIVSLASFGVFSWLKSI